MYSGANSHGALLFLSGRWIVLLWITAPLPSVSKWLNCTDTDGLAFLNYFIVVRLNYCWLGIFLSYLVPP